MKPRESQPVVSAVVACYRDELAIPIMYERLKRAIVSAGCIPELIFVNDSSPDKSERVLKAIAAQDTQVTVIKHSRAFGSQSAFASGMALCTGDACVLLDGDLQDPPELIPQFVSKWAEGYDVVYGQRVTREAPFYMRLFYKAFYRVFSRLAYVDVAMDAGDFALMDRRVVDAINSMPEADRFLRGMRAWVGFKQVGIPYKRPDRMFGETTNSMRKNFGWARRAIVSFSYAPLEWITTIALVVVGLSFFGLLAQLAIRISAPESAPQGLTTLISIILFLGGIQLLCLAILGSYVAHIYSEVKRRPAYVVEQIVNPPDSRVPSAQDLSNMSR